MREVRTVAPTYSEMAAILLARYLYIPESDKMSVEESLIFNRKFARWYNKCKDEPAVSQLI
jgi:hypothetical protein